jgi:hypothetical protein
LNEESPLAGGLSVTSSRAKHNGPGGYSWEAKLYELFSEAYDLKGRPELQQAVVEELVVRWDQHLPAPPDVGLLAGLGIGGLGKSTWLAGIAANGHLGNPGATLLVSFEDTAEEVLRPRCEPAGADLSPDVYAVRWRQSWSSSIRSSRQLTFA